MFINRRGERLIGIAWALSAFLIQPASTAPSPKQTAVEVVESFNECALLTARGEVCRIATTTRSLQTFLDLPAIAKRIFGAQWQAASVAERNRFSDLIGQIVERRMVEHFGDRSVLVEDSRSLPNGDTLVTGEFIARNELMTRLTWQLRSDANRMVIEDVGIDGASVIIAARDQIQVVAAQSDGTIDSLISILRERYLRN